MYLYVFWKKLSQTVLQDTLQFSSVLFGPKLYSHYLKQTLQEYEF